ncbi:carbohydrate kinase family protein [Pseudonocardia nigra]|uniref:carbohydrate kinase family protein n=1 Tax=Pseudonocardia nigra TaxID=1921578 RepID=UPI001C5F7B44|nr:PfkB family carbohydrate kinase [Pseudonocardia nigra]
MASRHTPSIVFVGAVTLDAIALVDHFPQVDERQIARAVRYAGGGPAATAAVAAARLGVPAALVGVVGADGEGEQILAALRAEGVDVSGVQVVPDRASGASVVIVDAGRGTRAICTRPVPPLVIPAAGRAAELLADAAWVHVDHLGWQPVEDWIASAAGPSRPRISVDAGNPIAGFRPVGVALYVPTVEALVRAYGDLAVDDLLDAALRDGADTVVATRGGAGSVAATADGTRVEAPGHPVRVVSTLGAGDVFHGALLAAVAHGMPLQACLHYANVAAALSCRGLDGRSAIPTHREVLAAVPVASTSSARSEEIS